VHKSLTHYFQVIDSFKAKPFKVNLSDYFQDVDTLLAIAFQIALHNSRKAVKASGGTLPPSKRRGKGKQALLRPGDGVQGKSTAEVLERKEGELIERRKRKKDNTVSVLLLFCCLC
jgi:hypothetical protein